MSKNNVILAKDDKILHQMRNKLTISFSLLFTFIIIVVYYVKYHARYRPLIIQEIYDPIDFSEIKIERHTQSVVTRNANVSIKNNLVDNVIPIKESYISFNTPNTITSLTIEDSNTIYRLNDSLPNLIKLIILRCGNFESINGDFDSLRTILISRCPKLTQINGNMNNLSSLVLTNVPNLNILPNNMFNIRTLSIRNNRALTLIPTHRTYRSISCINCTALVELPRQEPELYFLNIINNTLVDHIPNYPRLLQLVVSDPNGYNSQTRENIEYIRDTLGIHVRVSDIAVRR
jgi:hypothetical protein